MAYCVFGELLAPDYAAHYCLGGPYSSPEEVKEAAKLNGWTNWITGDGAKEYTPGQLYKLEVPSHPDQTEKQP